MNNVWDVYHKAFDVGDYVIIGHGISSGPEYPQYKEDLEMLDEKELEKTKNEYEKNLAKQSQ